MLKFIEYKIPKESKNKKNLKMKEQSDKAPTKLSPLLCPFLFI
jgi:hypothetical protein